VATILCTVYESYDAVQIQGTQIEFKK
jgi:hypothetical protein